MTASVVADLVFVGFALAVASAVPLVVLQCAMADGGKRAWTEALCWSFAIYCWFSVAAWAARPAIFDVAGEGRLGFPVMFAGGLLIGGLALLFIPAARRRVAAVPLEHLVALQCGRVIGAYFIVLAAQGRADWTFALIAGGGDILVGLTALAAARAIARRPGGGQGIALAHTALGLADFAVAIAVAFSLGAALDWPGPLIPLWLVPLATLVHFVTIAAALRRR